MMKKILLIALFSLLASDVFSAEYWVYIRLEDRFGPRIEDTNGRSKRGDIVDIVPITQVPTEREKQEYAIEKWDLTRRQVSELRSPRSLTENQDGEIKVDHYRNQKVDVDSLGIVKGLNTNLRTYDEIKNDIREKTALDRAYYNAGTVMYAMARPVRLAWDRYIDQKAYAAVNTYSVNHSGEDYNTLTLWEDARDGDLAGETRSEIVEVYNDDGVLNDSVELDGSTTSATYYMTITSPSGERHTGIEGTGAAIEYTSELVNGGAIIKISDFNAVVEWLEVKNWETNFSGGAYAIFCNQIGSNCTIRYNIVHDDRETNAAANIQGIRLQRGGQIIGNIVYNIQDNAIHETDDFGTTIIDQNTVYNYDSDETNGANVGIRSIGLSGSLRNNLVISGVSTGPNYAAYDADITSDYNGCSDSAPSGYCDATNDVDGLTTSVFADYSNDDLRLASSSGAIDAGTTLGGDAATDIEGETRSGTYDLGADEYIAAASTRRIWLIHKFGEEKAKEYLAKITE